jgi:predicted GH43/DUF377 family glycosyl hydrolase
MTPKVARFPENPLITPEQVTPTLPGWEVVSTINAGAIMYEGEVLLLVRVAERPRTNAPDEIVASMLDFSATPPKLKVISFSRNDPDIVANDHRGFAYKGQTYLTSISHLRVARSRNGRHFTLEDSPALEAAEWYESFGLEDPRITLLEGRYLITYTAVSQHGIATALTSTQDFRNFVRHGLIFPPENRDVTIFPETINGRYVCHHRPVGHHIMSLDLWAAFSPDLAHWGEHIRVMGCSPGLWDASRIGGGAVPFRTDRGWLSIYHGADELQRYCLGAMLCDPKHPEIVIARSTEPLLLPEAPYEIEGFFGNIVFTCGAILQDDTLTIYYGAADTRLCGA